MKVIVNNKTFVVEEHVLNKDVERCFNIFYNGEHISTYTTFKSTEEKIINRLEKYLSTFNSKEDLLMLLDAEENLPKHLKKSIKYCISEGKLTELLEVFMIDYTFYCDRIISLLSKVSLIINRPYDEVLKLTDYKHKDTQWYRLNDAFAELRVILILDQNGFTNIQLLKAANNNKQVDILANYQDKLLTIDVAHSKSGYYDENRFESIYKIVNHLNNIYIKKKEQLQQSLAEYIADEIVIAVVIDEINNITALNDSEELRIIARQIYIESDLYNECGLVLLLNGDGYIFRSNMQEGGATNGNTIT
jgi:hypothetical protein